MGYDTTFRGGFQINPTPSTEITEYIHKFANVRHMTRNPEIIKKIDPEWEKHCWKGNLGKNGMFYCVPDTLNIHDVPEDQNFWISRLKINETTVKNFAGQIIDKSVIEDTPPAPLPGYWCDWECKNNELTWNGNEKFYDYKEWLEFLIQYIFAPEGYVLNGTVRFQGDDMEDHGKIKIADNNITIEYGV